MISCFFLFVCARNVFVLPVLRKKEKNIVSKTPCFGFMEGKTAIRSCAAYLVHSCGMRFLRSIHAILSGGIFQKMR